MAFVHYNEASAGLPNSGRLSGTNGDLVGILDVVLVAAGWAIEFTTTNKRVYRPATGNRFRLWVQDDSSVSGAATLATVRGCESASSATSVTDAFPTSALVADGSANWLKSNAANTTARAFDIWAWDTGLIYVVNFAGTSNVWEIHFFGDCPSNISGDIYNTLIWVRNTASASASNAFTAGTTGGGGNPRTWLCRSYDGTVKSVMAGIWAPSTSLGNLTTLPAARAGPTGKIDRKKAVVADPGSTTGTISVTLGVAERCWIPNLWVPLHGGMGTANVRDTWQDLAYNAAATFQYVSASNGAAAIIIETSNTWAKPA